MTHISTKADAASDLRRCIYASFSKQKFEDPVFLDFLKHAKMILKTQKINNIVYERIKKAEDIKLNEDKRREDLLTASIILQNG